MGNWAYIFHGLNMFPALWDKVLKLGVVWCPKVIIYLLEELFNGLRELLLVWDKCSHAGWVGRGGEKLW